MPVPAFIPSLDTVGLVPGYSMLSDDWDVGEVESNPFVNWKAFRWSNSPAA
jgi:hypothetical protein